MNCLNRRKTRVIEGTPPHQMVVFVLCETGYCGSSSTDLLLVDPTCNVSEITHEMALENAQSHGYEGDYVCPECGSNTEGELCEDCGVRSQWEENDSVAGYAEQFILSKHCARIGGFEWSYIWNVLLEADAVVLVCQAGEATEYHVKRERLFGETGLFNDAGDPQGEWNEFVKDVTFAGYKVVDWVVDS